MKLQKITFKNKSLNNMERPSNKYYQILTNFHMITNGYNGNLGYKEGPCVRYAFLDAYFSNLRESGTVGAQLAKTYMKRSKEIGKNLVGDGVAQSEEDVNSVLMNGFYWLYGPINDYI